MNPTKVIPAAILILATAGAWAQAPSPQKMNNQPEHGNTTIRPETHPTVGVPFTYQTDYDGMGGIPPYRVEATNPSYIGVLGEKWETDKRGRRSTFIHDGQEISVGVDQQKNDPVHKSQPNLPGLPHPVRDSLVGIPLNLP